MARGAPKGHRKWGGRAKGTPNKSTDQLFALCTKKGVDAFDRMLDLAISEPDKDKQFLKWAKIAEYLYAKRKAVEHSGEIEMPGPKISEESLEERIKKLKGK